ncbi:MAG TPA: sigma-70 family RNA polymerase sigma factor [Thermoanaerobaculia bacterium]|nr:sigma-70 family RNA polymerase sigma factor [Thermoanaerobaculia bacterium]
MSEPATSDAFRRLYDTYFRAVVRYLVRFRFTREEAQDLAQEVFVRVYRHMDRYRGEAPWKFLRTTAGRVALNELRRRAAKMRAGGERSAEELGEDWESSVTETVLTKPAPTPEQELLEREAQEDQARRRQRLREAIELLPEGTRSCLLARLSGLQYDEVADAFGISMDAVKSRLHDARRRLRELLREEPSGVDWPPDSEG